MTRTETTSALTRLAESRIRRRCRLWAPEVEVPGDGRVDFMGFQPYGDRPDAASIERGKLVCYEVKSCMADFDSGHGLNFVGDENWLVCPRDLAERLRGKSIGCGILVPDKAGRLRTFVEQPFGGYRKLSASELIWRMLRTSYGIEGGAQNAD